MKVFKRVLGVLLAVLITIVLLTWSKSDRSSLSNLESLTVLDSCSFTGKYEYTLSDEEKVDGNTANNNNANNNSAGSNTGNTANRLHIRDVPKNCIG